MRTSTIGLLLLKAKIKLSQRLRRHNAKPTRKSDPNEPPNNQSALQNSGSPLLDLPAELRLRIYKHVLANSNTPYPLSQVSSLIRREVVYDFCRLHTITLDASDPQACSALDAMSDRDITSLRCILIQLPHDNCQTPPASPTVVMFCLRSRAPRATEGERMRLRESRGILEEEDYGMYVLTPEPVLAIEMVPEEWACRWDDWDLGGEVRVATREDLRDLLAVCLRCDYLFRAARHDLGHYADVDAEDRLSDVGSVRSVDSWITEFLASREVSV